jgi:hypothetical protein
MDDKLKELEKEVVDLKKELKLVANKRIFQQNIMPGALKNRHFSEANSYIYNVDSSKLPATGQSVAIGTDIRYEEDTKKIKIWNSTTNDWDEIQAT